MLLILLLPAGIGLMALAWIIHGALLERMSTDFVESRLKDEVAFLEHQIRQSGGRTDTLQTGDYFQEVFHHAFAMHAGACVHLETLYGDNSHHIAESGFKALARALRTAVELDPKTHGHAPSTKGVL